MGNIKKAMDELEEISQDYELRRLAELKEKAIKDESNMIAHAKREGKSEGIKEGKREGIKEGIKQEKIEIAKKLLSLNISIEQIMKITELNEEEIIKLKDN